MKAAVDRIEGSIAILVTCGDEPAKITLPSTLLPPGTREGDIISLSIGRDEEATRAAKEQARRLIEKLKKGT